MGKGMAAYASILAWEIPWTEEPGGLQPMESQESQTWLNDQITITTMENQAFESQI